MDRRILDRNGQLTKQEALNTAQEIANEKDCTLWVVKALTDSPASWRVSWLPPEAPVYQGVVYRIRPSPARQL
jgi:spore coat polysaccharide biosynthesis protein SpsF (cytidylyltransferase family)